MNELEIVEWARNRARAHSSILAGIGDDMAVIAAPGSQILLSSDLLLDGVHFDSKIHTPAQIGRKAVARALSDCAAMAVQPVAVLVSVALPKEMSAAQVRDLFEAMNIAAEEFGAGIAGGDTARWKAPLAIDICISAQPYPGIEPARRGGAQLHDILYVTGELGGSILGRHLTFVPRIHEARDIAARLGGSLHAMMDISDGLALDLWRMCEASSLGATLEESLLAKLVSRDAHTCTARDGVAALQHALFDGEDYELLLSVAPTADIRGVPIFPIGRIDRSNLHLKRINGSIEPLQPRGFVH